MSRAAQSAHEPTSAGEPSLDRKALSGPALRTFFRIAELWGLSADEQMTLLGLLHVQPFSSGNGRKTSHCQKTL